MPGVPLGASGFFIEKSLQKVCKCGFGRCIFEATKQSKMNNEVLIRYAAFIAQKRHSVQDCGITPLWIPDAMFPHQRHVTELAIRRGRFANFLDTGLGKTLIELVIAENYVRHTNKPVLIMCPLAVAFQFLKDAEKFGIGDIEYSKDGKHSKKIVVCNYERIHYFDSSKFDCVILDESSILKNAEGKTREAVTNFMKKVKYRFLNTATPAPNDFVELGTSSEALGYLGYMDMLSKFFTNAEQGTISPQNIGTKWRLKGHAEKAFFDWVATWSITVRKPSDIGFDDSGYILPELVQNQHWVKNEKPLVVGGQYQMFNIVAKTNREILAERRATVEGRCEKAAELAAGHETSVYWVNLDDEADIIERLDQGAVQIKGPMSIEQKEEILLAFLDGGIKHLITKPRITAFGLNWQHCNHTTVFPSFSYEQYYQLIRRFLRFGQTKPVVCDLVFSDGQKRVLDALLAKAAKADQLFDTIRNATGNYEVVKKQFDKPVVLPSFLNK
jgi:hypothetical protein